MNWALEQRHLKPGAWIVLIQLADRHNKDSKLCRPEQALLAHDCNMSRATLNRYLTDLEATGLIRRVARVHPATRKQLATQYILAIDFDDPPHVDFPACPELAPVPVAAGAEQAVSETDSRVSNLDTETVSQNPANPCLKNGQIRVSNRDTSNPVREPKREPDARAAREAGVGPEPGSDDDDPNPADAEAESQNDIDLDEAFAQFWAIYPLPEQQSAARRAWRRVVTTRTVNAVLAAARAYHDDERVRRGFTKLPANWLLDRCWQDRPVGPVARPPAPPREVDLDALAGLWAPKLAAGAFVPPSAISAALARHMLDRGLVTRQDLRRSGVSA